MTWHVVNLFASLPGLKRTIIRALEFYWTDIISFPTEEAKKYGPECLL